MYRRIAEFVSCCIEPKCLFNNGKKSNKNDLLKDFDLLAPSGETVLIPGPSKRGVSQFYFDFQQVRWVLMNGCTHLS